MIDARAKKLAEGIVGFSLDIRKGENVLIECYGYDEAFIGCLMEEVFRAGGYPYVDVKEPRLERIQILNGSREYLDRLYSMESYRMERMDAYIGVRFPRNMEEHSGIGQDVMNTYADRYNSKLHMGIRCPKTRWVVLRYPTPSMAQAAKMSTEAFEDFYFNVCNLDYGRMSAAMDPLVSLMEKTDMVRITAPGTDISFSIKDMGVEKCSGNCNLPDGEAYSAPVRDSVNGVISYNTTSLQRGFVFENVKLVFVNGRIVEATANDTARINEVLDTDDGARYVGEFAIGVNPYIVHPMNETLFDEKIRGSIHFTPGNCVAGCKNGNESLVHWDLVLIQTAEYGGGDIWFDGRLIRRNGLFVLDELKGLNPENLA